jgi:hypothetical protein
MQTESETLCYAVSTIVAAPAGFAFAYLASPVNVGEWALGSFGARRIGSSDLYAGSSLYDHSEAMFRIDSDEARLLIDYLLGNDPAHLAMRISTRVIPGAAVDRDEKTCIVSMIAWRPASFDDRRWQLLRAFHDAEAHILRSRIERAYLGGDPRPSSLRGSSRD